MRMRKLFNLLLLASFFPIGVFILYTWITYGIFLNLTFVIIFAIWMLMCIYAYREEAKKGLSKKIYWIFSFLIAGAGLIHFLTILLKSITA